MNEIVKTEAKRMAIGMILLSSAVCLGFVLLGYDIPQTIVSVLFGTLYSFVLFFMVCTSAAKAAAFPAVQAMRYIRRGYVVRYLLTGVIIVFILKAPFFNMAAAILPLFFPKIILLVSSILLKKGG